MNWWHKIEKRFRALFRKDKLDQEMDDEMRFHLEQQTRDNIEAGMKPEEARYAALRSFGGMEQVKEVCRDLRGVGWMETLWRDARLGCRVLRRNLGFTAVAVLTLAVGIGANTAIFSLIDGVWLRSMPFADPSCLVRIFASTPKEEHGHLSYPDYLDLRSQMRSLSDLFINAPHGTILVGEDESEHLRADTVSRNFFSILGIRPHLGRFFSEADEPDLMNAPTVVLSHRLWQRRFGGNTNLIGRSIVLSDQSRIILGIAPPGFDGLERLNPADVWYPADTWWLTSPREHRTMTVVGRLKAGCTLEQAQTEAETIFRRLELRDPVSHAELKALVQTLARFQFEKTGTLSLMLLGIVGTVLLMTCANVSSLLLARAEVRAREMAVRSALGGSRSRLVRQLLAESLVLSSIAAVVSLFLARWLIASLPALLPPGALALGSIASVVRLDGRVVCFTAAVSLLTILLFGLAPALHASRPDLLPVLKGDMAFRGPGRKHSVLNALVVGQMSVALVLVSMAALLTRSLLAYYATDLGFEKKEVLMVSLSTGNQEQGRAFYRQLKERVVALPGVKQASLARVVPFAPSGLGAFQTVFLPDDGASASGRLVKFNAVDPDYFGLLGLRILRGRGFTERDDKTGPRVMLINETMATGFWPKEDPVGKSVRLGSPTNEAVEIVGVVRDTKLSSIAEKPEPYLCLPFAQHYHWEAILLVEGAVPMKALVGPVRTEIRALGVKPSRSDIGTMNEYIHARLSQQEFLARMVVVLGLLGLGLASVGLHGVLAYVVGQRTREIGIRMALGAQRHEVLGMVLRRGLVLAFTGVALGLPITLTAAHLSRGFLYGVSPLDPFTISMSGVLLLAVAGLAIYFPARRAARVDPMVALRYE